MIKIIIGMCVGVILGFVICAACSVNKDTKDYDD